MVLFLWLVEKLSTTTSLWVFLVTSYIHVNWIAKFSYSQWICHISSCDFIERLLASKLVKMVAWKLYVCLYWISTLFDLLRTLYMSSTIYGSIASKLIYLNAFKTIVINVSYILLLYHVPTYGLWTMNYAIASEFFCVACMQMKQKYVYNFVSFSMLFLHILFGYGILDCELAAKMCTHP